MLASLLPLLLLPTVVAYAEGNAPAAPVRWLEALAWDTTAEVSDCAVLSAGAAVGRVLVSLPANASELEAARVCVFYTERSDTASNWWFVAPPAAKPPHRACAPAQRSQPIVVALDGLTFPRGYTRLTAWLDQPKDSTTPLVAAIDAVLSVVDAPSNRPAWLGPPSLAPGAASGLGEAYRVVREDERPEKEAYATRTHEGRERYAPQHMWPQHPEPSVAALRGLIAPQLLAALERPSPATLWALVKTPSARHPVHQFVLFSRAGARRLASELAHAHATLRDAQPTNNMSGGETRSAAPEEGPPSLLLDEVHLHAVAHSIAAGVLAPLAKLVYPAWTNGGVIDSYHAFSIHRRSRAADQSSWFRPSSNSEGGAAPSNASCARSLSMWRCTPPLTSRARASALSRALRAAVSTAARRLKIRCCGWTTRRVRPS
mmetsp:Transcript_32578/g.108710  ORF Transcript_32578/g.108710 Transcript_32578/m.108710 type:complete len:431 (+) Transcript_32578:138-1430(+)